MYDHIAYKTCFVICLLALGVKSQYSAVPESSPCPRVFSYEVENSIPGRWYGLITISTDVTLYGVWINVILDKQADALASSFGDVTSSDNRDFKLENTRQVLTPSTQFQIRIYINYNSVHTAPKLRSLRLNGREICATAFPIITTSIDQNKRSTNIYDRRDNFYTTSTSNPYAYTRQSDDVFTRREISQTEQGLQNNRRTPSYNNVVTLESRSGSVEETSRSSPTNRYSSSPTSKSTQYEDVINIDRSRNKDYDKRNSEDNIDRTRYNQDRNTNNNHDQGQSGYNNGRERTEYNNERRDTTNRRQTGYDERRETSNSGRSTSVEYNNDRNENGYDRHVDRVEIRNRVIGYNQESETDSRDRTVHNQGRETGNSDRTGYNQGRETDNRDRTGSNQGTQTSNSDRTGYNQGRETGNRDRTGSNQGTQTSNNDRTGYNQGRTGNRDRTESNQGTQTSNSDRTGQNNQDREIDNRDRTVYNQGSQTSDNERTGYNGGRTEVNQDRVSNNDRREYNQGSNRDQTSHNQNGRARDEDDVSVYALSNVGGPRGRGHDSSTRRYHNDPIPATTPRYEAATPQQKFNSDYDRDREGFRSSSSSGRVSPLSPSIRNSERDNRDHRGSVSVSTQTNPQIPSRSDSPSNTRDNNSEEDYDSGDNDRTSSRKKNGNRDTSDDYFEGDHRIPDSEKIYPTPVSHNSGNHNQNHDQATCGKVAVRATPLIVSGELATQGQWPWHVALYQSQTVDSKYICGGSLISLSHILTAAHCVTRKTSTRPVNPQTLTLYLGKFNLRKASDGVQIMLVRKITIHPEYNATNFYADLGILKMTRRVEYSDVVRPVCLWREQEKDLSNVIDREGSVVGWGFDENDELKEDLAVVRMPVVKQTTCLWSFKEFFSHFTSNHSYCAGYANGTSVCNGDSGGGMVFPLTSRDSVNPTWHLRGVVSISVARQNDSTCDPYHYVVFTDVAQFLGWIHEKIS